MASEEAIVIEDMEAGEEAAEKLFKLNAQIKSLTDEAKRLKDAIGVFVEKHGEADSGGSKVLEFDEYSATRQRRVKVEIDQEKAVAKCKELGEGGCVVVKEEVDEKKFEALIADETLSSQDVKKMVKETETFAILVKKI